MIDLDKILEGAVTAGIAGHVRPDGDAVGSCLGFAGYLREAYPGLKVNVHLETVQEEFRFLKGADLVITDASEDIAYDVFFCLDCADVQRLGDNIRYFRSAAHTVCIDHHISNPLFAQENLVRPDASSTSELICDLIPKEALTRPVAEALYLGIVHDTGVFQYSCTSSHTMELAGKLMDTGIDYPRIVADTFFARSFPQTKAMGKVLSRSELYLDGQLILGSITCRESSELGLRPADLNGIVEQLRNTAGPCAAAFLYETRPSEWRISLRTGEPVDGAKIASHFGGGGHVRAAGCTLTGTLDEVTEKLLKQIALQLS